MCLPLTPFKIEAEFMHAGLMCAVTQNREGEFRCGYVRVPPTHVAYGKDYDEVDVDVHYGLTFSSEEECSDHPDGKGHWFGFDCAHYGDAMYDPDYIAPELGNLSNDLIGVINTLTESPDFSSFRKRGHYWTYDEVVAETKQLAEQFANMSNIAEGYKTSLIETVAKEIIKKGEK